MNADDHSSSSSNGDSADQEPHHELTRIRPTTATTVYGPVKLLSVEEEDDQSDNEHDHHHNNNNNNPRHIRIDDAVELLGMGPFQYSILLAAGLCFAADSMEVLLLSFLAVVLRAVWNLTDQQAATITSAVFVGALLGTLVLGTLGDKWGRKPVFTLTAAIICISGFLTAVANNFATLLAFRFLVGFGVGGLTVPFDTLAGGLETHYDSLAGGGAQFLFNCILTLSFSFLCTEFVPNSHRGSNLLLIEYFWTAGTLRTSCCLLILLECLCFVILFHFDSQHAHLHCYFNSRSGLGLFEFWGLGMRTRRRLAHLCRSLWCPLLIVLCYIHFVRARITTVVVDAGQAHRGAPCVATRGTGQWQGPR